MTETAVKTWNTINAHRLCCRSINLCASSVGLDWHGVFQQVNWRPISKATILLIQRLVKLTTNKISIFYITPIFAGNITRKVNNVENITDVHFIMLSWSAACPIHPMNTLEWRSLQLLWNTFVCRLVQVSLVRTLDVFHIGMFILQTI